MEEDPSGLEEEPVSPHWHDAQRYPPAARCGNFRIPHAEKIEWMIETNGWALEPVAARPDDDPPMPGYCYTIGLPTAHEFPEVVVFGLTPVATRGLLDLVVEQLAGGVVIPVDTTLVGLFDNDLRCVFATVEVDRHAEAFATGVAWHGSADFPMVQLLWPDRNGWLPHESGFDARVRAAQPVIGRIPQG